MINQGLKMLKRAIDERPKGGMQTGMPKIQLREADAVRAVAELEWAQQRITELAATIERLRELLQNYTAMQVCCGQGEIQYSSEGEPIGQECCGRPDVDWPEDVVELLSSTPQQNLNAIKRQEFERFQQWSLNFVCSPDFESLKRKVFRKLNSGVQGQQVAPHNDPEYCGLLALLSEYANTKYPSVKDGE